MTLYKRVKCPDCVWSQFQDEAVGMTPCPHCNSTGYLYEPVEPEPDEAEGDGVTYILSCDKCGALFCSSFPSPQLCSRCSNPDEGEGNEGN